MNLYDRLKRVVVEFSPLGKKGFGTVSFVLKLFLRRFLVVTFKEFDNGEL